jgi:hypothetical protein
MKNGMIDNQSYWALARVIAFAALLSGMIIRPVMGKEPEPGVPYGRDVPFGQSVAPPRTRILLRNLVMGRYNPMGLVNQTRIGVQRVLYRQSSPLLRQNFAFAGALLKFTPTSSQIGGVVELAPVSVFRVQSTLEWIHYYRVLDSFQSFGGAEDDYSDGAIAARTADKLTYASSGLCLTLSPVVQFRWPVGNSGGNGESRFYLAVRNVLSMMVHRMHTIRSDRADGARDPVWYSSALDTLVPAHGWTLQNRLEILLQTRHRFWMGVSFTVVHPLYSRSSFRTPAAANAYHNDNGHQRLGPLFVYRFFDRAFTRFNQPTILVIANWYLSHRWKDGAETSRAIPYVLIGFSFQMDLLQPVNPVPGKSPL